MHHHRSRTRAHVDATARWIGYAFMPAALPLLELPLLRLVAAEILVVLAIAYNSFVQWSALRRPALIT